MLKIVMLPLILLMSLLMAGCASSTIAPRFNQIGKNKNIVIIDMRSDIKNKLLVAQATFHNKSDKQVSAYYRCQFFDENKMKVGHAENWQLVTLYPNEDQSVKCLASQQEATNFKVEISTNLNNISVGQPH